MNSVNVRNDFARAIKWWRSHLDISQEELAERANLHRTYISDVERGARNLSLESISRLATALEISIPTLFSTKGTPEGGATNGARQWVEILLAEANSNDATMTLQAFNEARFENRVHVVRDGAEALDCLFHRGTYAERSECKLPQIFLLDLKIPKVDALEVLRRIKAEKGTQQIPVVVLASSRDDGNLVETRRLGAEAQIVKPVDFQKLSEVTPKLRLNWALVRPSSSKQT
jgi:CheY-like chemotaxis protein